MESPIAVQVYSNSTLKEILDDLCIRFLMFLPEQELSSIERICFQIEEANWYYEDFIREINPGLPNMHLKQFIQQIINHVPRSLIAHIPLWKTETAFTDFMTYKTRVPVRGCIMLNSRLDKCVLVKGWKSGSSWSFPRGKIDQNEDDRDCAIREVKEETGYDLTGKVEPDNRIDMNIREQDMRLYIAPGVPEDTHFAPQTRKEISKISWHKLSDLPGYHTKKSQRDDAIRHGKFFLVAPFVRELRKWISANGKDWKAQQAEAAAAATRVVEAARADNSEPQTEQEDDSATSLKNLLGIKGSAKTYVDPGDQSDASQRLKNMIGANGSNQRHGPPSAQPENPNAKTLLSILQGGPASSQPVPHNSPPSHTSEQPAFIPTNANMPPFMNHPNSQQYPVQHQQYRQAPQPPFARQDSQPAPANLNMSAGWQQGIQNPANMPRNYQLPSPPPTSRYGPPSAMDQSYSYQLTQNPQNQPNQPFHSQLPPQPAAHQQTSGPMRAQFGGGVGFPPPTPVDAFPQQFMPVKQQDPGQAGALLSILKGTGPSPVAHTPPPSRIPLQTPVGQTPPALQHIAPPPMTHVSQAQQAQGAVATSLDSPGGPSNHVSLQAPPPPRGPKAQNSQRSTPQRQRFPSSGRPSSTIPASQAAHPPPRSTTAQPQYHAAQPPPPLRRGTPVNIDNYGAQKQVLPAAKFDRRNSVSGEQAQTLLAMFRQQTPASPLQTSATTAGKENAKPTPEIPTAALASGSASISKGKTPAGKERAGLLAYLESVANQSGVF